MPIYFAQFYIEAGVSFPFSHLFQCRLSDEVTTLIAPSAFFAERYGDDWDLIIRISAKSAIQNTEVRGPTVFKRDKDVEYSIFLPFSTIQQTPDVLRAALRFLFDSFLPVLTSLGFSTDRLASRQFELIESICSDAKMVALDGDRRAV